MKGQRGASGDVQLVFEGFTAKQMQERVSSCNPLPQADLGKFSNAVNTQRVKTPGDFRKHFIQSGALQVGRISPTSPFIVSTQQTYGKPA